MKKISIVIVVSLFLLLTTCMNVIEPDKLTHTNPYDLLTDYQSQEGTLINTSALSLIKLTHNEIQFQWNIDQDEYFSHYNIYTRTSDLEPWALVDQAFGRGENQFLHTALTPKTIYQYRIESVDKKARTNSMSEVSYMTSPWFRTRMDFQDQASVLGVGRIRKLLHVEGRYYFLYYGAEPTYGLGGPMIYSNTSGGGPGLYQNLFIVADDGEVFGGVISRNNVLFREYDPDSITPALMSGQGLFNYQITTEGVLYGLDIKDFYVYKDASSEEALIMVYEVFGQPLVGYPAVDVYARYTNQANNKTNSQVLSDNLQINQSNTIKTFVNYAYSVKNPLKFQECNGDLYCLFSDLLSGGMDLRVSKMAFTGVPSDGSLDFDLAGEDEIIASVISSVPGLTNGYILGNNLGAQITGFEVTPEYIYIANGYRGYVLQFDILGNYLRTIGSAGLRYGEFSFISHILSYDNNLFVCDRDNQRVQIFNANGLFISSVGIPGSGEYGFVEPSSISVFQLGPTMLMHISDRSWIKEFELGDLTAFDGLTD